jgi:hypothetical protein
VLLPALAAVSGGQFDGWRVQQPSRLGDLSVGDRGQIQTETEAEYLPR